jgi:hypothetical protein
MTPLPDDALVVRGGQNLPESFAKGSGVTMDPDGKLDGVSVNSGANATVDQLTGPNAHTGYPGIVHNQIGVTTVGKIRTLGGDVIATPSRTNPNHATLSGITPEEASKLFRPTSMNPNRRKK